MGKKIIVFGNKEKEEAIHIYEISYDGNPWLVNLDSYTVNVKRISENFSDGPLKITLLINENVEGNYNPLTDEVEIMTLGTIRKTLIDEGAKPFDENVTFDHNDYFEETGVPNLQLRYNIEIEKEKNITSNKFEKYIDFPPSPVY